MKRSLFCSVLLLLHVLNVSGLKISNAAVEVEIHEQNGRFSIFAIQESGEKVALLVAEDPRTTLLTILAGSKVYRMGDSFEFRQTLESTSDSAEISWTSSKLTVNQRFELDGSALTISLRIENTSEQDLDVGVRYLLDTYLGEKGIHFTVDGLPVESETDYSWNVPFDIQSSDDESVALRILLTGADITAPDRVVIANWKRLSDASWTFEAKESRDFNLRPYSINDSAIALYFEPKTVSSSSNLSLSFKLDWRAPGVVSYVATDSTGQQSMNYELLDAILNEIEKLDSVLSEIDDMLASGQPPLDSDIAGIRGELEVLSERKKEYSGRQ